MNSETLGCVECRRPATQDNVVASVMDAVCCTQGFKLPKRKTLHLDPKKNTLRSTRKHSTAREGEGRTYP